MEWSNFSNKSSRMLDLEKDAANRTLNGNGSNPNLPPLPACDDDNIGLGTLFSHPYGALPYGNVFVFGVDSVRMFGLGKDMSKLNDDQILYTMQFLDGCSLAQVSSVSRFLYVAAHHEELWRDLVLRKYESSSIVFKSSWKDTFIWMQFIDGGNKIEFIKHHPITIQGICSDTFFRSWLCRSFALQTSWLSFNNICEEIAHTLSTEDFLSKYEEKNLPVLVKGATSSWPAIQKWNKEYLLRETDDLLFRATSGAAPVAGQFTLESYFDYCDSTTEEAPLYLFDRTFSEKCPQLLKDYSDGLKASCPYFDKNAKHGHDLFSLLGNGKRPDHRWIIIGPKRSGSCFHIDPNATHAWNAPIKGRKRWILYPPSIPPPGVFPSPSGDDVIMPISLGEWFLTFWDDHVKQRSNPVESMRPIECTCHPGDIMFVPHGWWHCVLNLDDGISIAITQNYVSQSNLPDVLRFLRTKQQQISGCRDREEAIQPNDLYNEFTKKLKESRSDLLNAAQIASLDSWQCAAWNDNAKNIEILKSQRKRKTKSSVLQRAKLNSNLSDTKKVKIEEQFSFSFSLIP